MSVNMRFRSRMRSLNAPAEPSKQREIAPPEAPSSTVCDDLPAAFRQAMRNISSTVYVITLSSEGRRWGLTATAVSSLSMEPPSILACINHRASIHAPLIESERFCLNALRCDQSQVASAFSSSGLGEDRFRAGRWVDFGGAPAICDAVANILCRRSMTTSFGSHTVLVGEVEAVRVDDQAPPLIYRQGTFG